MATALFVKMEDIKRNSAISGSVDTDKFIQFVKIVLIYLFWCNIIENVVEGFTDLVMNHERN